MKKIILLFFTFNFLNHAQSCDCAATTIVEGYNLSSKIVLGKIIKAESITYIMDKGIKDSIQRHYGVFVPNDTINFIEYTVKIKKNYKNSEETANLIIRANANKSNCDLKFVVGETYLIYSSPEWWHNLYYPHDKSFILSTMCTRTTKNWRKEKKVLENYLNKID